MIKTQKHSMTLYTIYTNPVLGMNPIEDNYMPSGA